MTNLPGLDAQLETPHEKRIPMAWSINVYRWTLGPVFCVRSMLCWQEAAPLLAHLCTCTSSLTFASCPSHVANRQIDPSQRVY